MPIKTSSSISSNLPFLFVHPVVNQSINQAALIMTELFDYAAVPLSDFVRLGLLQVYGGFWIGRGSTWSSKSDLENTEAYMAHGPRDHL